MADISQIVLLDESVYDLKDAVARGLLNGHSVGIDVPSNAVFTDTKNTAGSTDTSSKIFLIGATSQATNPQTYSHDTAYVGTDGCLYSGGTKVLTAHQSLSGKLDTSLKGAANGLAELDANGKVPSSQLPSYVDDVLEYSTKSSFPATGETGKIYVDTTTNLTYRWSGSAYVEISASLALGTTSSTAFRGDYGNSAYAHAVTNKGSAFSSGLYKITTNSEGHVTAATAVAKADITGLGIPGTDTNTHRPIQVNGTEVLGNNTTALNLKAGSNVSVTNSSGTVTIAATDTTYSSKAAASGGTDVSLVTTGEKYTWNSKTSNTGTVTKVSTGVGLTGGDITGSGTVKANLKSETASTLDSAAMGSTASRQYAVGVDKSGYLSVNIPWSNTVSITNLYNGGGNFIADSALYRYQLLFTKDENTLTPLNNVNNSTGTSKAMLTSVEFDPFGRIYYYATTTVVSANAAIAAGNLFWNFNGIDIRYTLNCGKTLTAHKPIYLVVTPTSGGKCTIASTTPWSQTLPSTNDGKWYILLGRTYSTYQIALYHFHPVYRHNGTSVEEVFPNLYTKSEIDSMIGDVETLLAAL